MKQRALPFDHVPMLRRRIRRQHLRRARLEVRHDRIHRHAAAGDHDAGLTRGPKIGTQAALLERLRDRKRGVLLAQGAIGSDRQESLTTALTTTGGRNASRWRADVDQTTPVTLGGCNQRRRVDEPGVHASHQIEPGFQRFEQRRHPAVENAPAHVGHADDHGAGSLARACAGVSLGKPSEIASGEHASSPTHCSGA